MTTQVDPRPGTQNGNGHDDAPSWLPKSVYDALPSEAKAGINSLRREMQRKDTLLQQAIEAMRANVVRTPANGNSQAEQPRKVGKYDQYKDEQLAEAIGNAFGLLQQGMPALHEAFSSGDPERIKAVKSELAAVNPAAISEILGEYVGRQVRAATYAMKSELANERQSQTLAARAVQEINGLFGADGFRQDDPRTERATELMHEAVQFLGKKSLEELSETEKALVMRNAYRQAASEHGASASGARRHDTTEGPGGGAGTSGRDATTDEVSALLNQGKKGEAELLAAGRMFAGMGGRVDPRVAVSPFGGRLPQPGR